MEHSRVVVMARSELADATLRLACVCLRAELKLFLQRLRGFCAGGDDDMTVCHEF